jgi:organic radical activating enzyme
MKIELEQLEVSAVNHCINHCAGCNHFSPMAKPYEMPVEMLQRDLEAIGKVVTVGKFAILGGEPLLHKKIDEFIEVAQQSGIAKVVSIVTNGQLLERMSERFWRTIKKLEIDVYPNKMSPEQVARIKEKCREYGIDWLIAPQSQFYKSCSQPGQSPEKIQARFDRCPTRKKCFCVDDGYFFRCPQASLIPKMFLGLDRTVDGLSLKDLTVEKLQTFLNEKTAFKSCARCSVEEQYIPWHEAYGDWLEESTL